MSMLHATMPDPKIKKEIKQVIDDIIAESKEYSIPLTLERFFTMKDTSAVFDYIKHMR